MLGASKRLMKGGEHNCEILQGSHNNAVFNIFQILWNNAQISLYQFMQVFKCDLEILTQLSIHRCYKVYFYNYYFYFS